MATISKSLVLQSSVIEVSEIMSPLQPRDLTGQIRRDGIYPFACGAFGDVYKATWQMGETEYLVAVKVLLPRSGNEEDRRKMSMRLRREIHVWRMLNHENIVPLLGTTSDFGDYSSACFVSPFMENGNLNSFLKRQGTTLYVGNRLQIICDVGAGLCYLHSKAVIHGDLTGTNVLIDLNGKAYITDFGLSAMKAEFGNTHYWPSTVGGAIRWRAPELLPTPSNNYAPVLNSPCDVYSFGSLTLQVLSGKVPYPHIQSDLCLLGHLFHGKRLCRPLDSMMTDDFWRFISWCCDENPLSRPLMNQAHQTVLGFRRNQSITRCASGQSFSTFGRQ